MTSMFTLMLVSELYIVASCCMSISWLLCSGLRRGTVCTLCMVAGRASKTAFRPLLQGDIDVDLFYNSKKPVIG